MKITVEFESLEEFQRYMSPTGSIVWNVSAKHAPREVVETTAPTACAPADPVPIPWDEAEKAAETPQEAAPEPKAEDPAPAEARPDYEALRVELRVLLTKVNKAAGRNVAKEMIQELGYKSLTAVPDEKLPELKEKAEARNG